MHCSDSELASDLEFSKPVFGQSLQDETVNEGQSVRLDCTITGVPEPEVIWYVLIKYPQLLNLILSIIDHYSKTVTFICTYELTQNLCEYAGTITVG